MPDAKKDFIHHSHPLLLSLHCLDTESMDLLKAEIAAKKRKAEGNTEEIDTSSKYIRRGEEERKREEEEYRRRDAERKSSRAERLRDEEGVRKEDLRVSKELYEQ